jgi:hypothetical protein
VDLLIPALPAFIIIILSVCSISLIYAFAHDIKHKIPMSQFEVSLVQMGTLSFLTLWFLVLPLFRLVIE